MLLSEQAENVQGLRALVGSVTRDILDAIRLRSVAVHTAAFWLPSWDAPKLWTDGNKELATCSKCVLGNSVLLNIVLLVSEFVRCDVHGEGVHLLLYHWDRPVSAHPTQERQTLIIKTKKYITIPEMPFQLKEILVYVYVKAFWRHTYCFRGIQIFVV